MLHLMLLVKEYISSKGVNNMPNDYSDDGCMIADNSDIRPDLKPEDPRGSFHGNNDFTIAGSIDNENTFNAATGRAEPARF